MSDEGFHEIQLGGKQLVFLFMAAAVVGVVLFLSGVMVGRGVRNEKAATAAQGPAVPVVDLAPASAEPGPSTSPGARPAVEPAAAQGAPQAAAPSAPPPPPVADGILRGTKPETPSVAERAPATTTPSAKPAPVPPSPSAKPAPAATTPPAKPAPAATTPPRTPESAAGTFAVQVAAPRDRASATAIVKRLVGKGYAAFVVEPTPGDPAPIYYRVRVGPFKSRSEAEEAKRRLEKEEQFKPFITR